MCHIISVYIFMFNNTNIITMYIITYNNNTIVFI